MLYVTAEEVMEEYLNMCKAFSSGDAEVCAGYSDLGFNENTTGLSLKLNCSRNYVFLMRELDFVDISKELHKYRNKTLYINCSINPKPVIMCARFFDNNRYSCVFPVFESEFFAKSYAQNMPGIYPLKIYLSNTGD